MSDVSKLKIDSISYDIKDAVARPTEITYQEWLLLTPEQQEAGNYIVSGYPRGGSVPLPDWNQTNVSAGDYIKNKPNNGNVYGCIPVNPADTTGLNIWIET